jgi:GatB/GatE catalytic domain
VKRRKARHRGRRRVEPARSCLDCQTDRVRCWEQCRNKCRNTCWSSSQSGHSTPFWSMLGRLPKCKISLQIRRLFHDVRAYQEDKRWLGWQVIVGIETHAQIKSRRKLFSGMFAVCISYWYASWTGTESLTSDIGEPPNTHVSIFDAAFPGTLPVNILAVRRRKITHCRSRSSTRNVWISL